MSGIIEKVPNWKISYDVCYVIKSGGNSLLSPLLLNLSN
jgi:hypothetical protein